MNKPSQIKRLQTNSVVMFDLYQNKRYLEITESGNAYYSSFLTKEEVGLLIEELTEIHKVMED